MRQGFELHDNINISREKLNQIVPRWIFEFRLFMHMQCLLRYGKESYE